MSWAEHTRSLIAYNRWANDKVLATAARLSETALDERSLGSHHSVRLTLVHTVRVQDWWLSVLKGAPAQTPEPDEHLNFGGLQHRFAASHEDLEGYGSRLSDTALAAEVAVFNPWEKRENRWPGWQLLSHLLNHSSHHRAEAGLMLDALGHSPGDLDFIFFLRELPG